MSSVVAIWSGARTTSLRYTSDSRRAPIDRREDIGADFALISGIHANSVRSWLPILDGKARNPLGEEVVRFAWNHHVGAAANRDLLVHKTECDQSTYIESPSVPAIK